MRLRALHVVPVWQEPDGTQRLGMEYEPDPPPVVGWSCVGVIDIEGQQHELVLNLEAA